MAAQRTFNEIRNFSKKERLQEKQETKSARMSRIFFKYWAKRALNKWREVEY